ASGKNPAHRARPAGGVAVTRELVGRVQVDHGRVVVCDPGYVALSERDEEAITSAQDAALLDFDEAGRGGLPDHLGVAVGTGWGDGCCPVFVERGRDAVDGTQVVARLVVDFLTTEEGQEAEALAAQSADGVEDVVRRRALRGQS